MNQCARLLLLLAIPAMALAARRLMPLAPHIVAPSEPSSGVQVIGPLAMLSLQREGQPIFDVRAQGRAIPGAVRRFPSLLASAPLVISVDGAQAQRWARARGWSGPVRWVPARLLEVHAQDGVAQVGAREVARQLARGEAEVIDVSEAGEWDVAHLPGSRRVDWRRIVQGDRSWVPRGKALVFT